MSYVRVKNIEKMVDCDWNTILRWEREGRIPHPQKDSRGWRFYIEEDIEKIMDFRKNNLIIAANIFKKIRNAVKNMVI
jgi:predicted site-specific integrase-resolvase